MARKKKEEGSQFVRYFGPLLNALRSLGGSGTADEVIERIRLHGQGIIWFVKASLIHQKEECGALLSAGATHHLLKNKHEKFVPSRFASTMNSAGPKRKQLNR
jgi:hypothetical protein